MGSLTVGKQTVVLVKEHQGQTATDYFQQLEKQGFRIDKVNLYTVHYPDDKQPPFKEFQINGLLDIIRHYPNMQKASIWVNQGKTLILPLITIKDVNAD